MIYLVILVLYLITSKLVLLPVVRKDIQMDYRTGDVKDRFYILLMLPIYYFTGKGN